VIRLQDTDFALFGLPEQFAQDAALITERWKSLQREAHPDHFASEGAAAQRVAAQLSARINEAYARLRDPLKRAQYLCALRGAPIDAENNTAMPPAFLMHQMEWRELLEEAQNEQNLDQIAPLPRSLLNSLLSQIEHSLDQTHDAKAAAQAVRQALFVQKFQQDLEAAYERLAT
jgi:molecular chaperone HscB